MSELAAIPGEPVTGSPAETTMVTIGQARGRSCLEWAGKHPPAEIRAGIARRSELHDPLDSGETERPNLLLHGDNEAALTWLLANGYRRQVRLVVIDPPFGSGSDYVRKVRLRGDQKTHKSGSQGVVEQVQYQDTWEGDTYLQFMFERLLLLRELLAEDGSLVLHVDKHRGHLLRAILDEVFGADRFVNEIVWHYPDNFQGNVKGFANNHDSLYWYAAGERFVHNPVRIRMDKPVKRDRRVWDAASKSIVGARDEQGKPIYDWHTHKKLDDVWRIGQSSVSKRRSAEHSGYPTQKPLALLERVIRAASNPGDLVLDCFLGSGTTAVAAQRLGRRWIGVDLSRGAVQVAVGRLTQAIRSGPQAIDDPKVETAPSAGDLFAVMQVEGGGIDARTGGSPVQQTPEGRVSVVPQGEGATVTVEDFMSPTLLDRLAATPQGGGVRAEVADWRAMVDHIQIDPDHDGEVFRVRVADHPVRHTDLVAGTYTLDRIGGMVAIRVTDMLGDDWTVTWTRD